MTTDELAKLDAIEARIRELMDIASKRTPGRWERVRTHLGTRGYPYTVVESKKADGHNYSIETPNSYDAIIPCVSLENAAFIASAAGPFEALLRGTLQTIERHKYRAMRYDPHDPSTTSDGPSYHTIKDIIESEGLL